MKPYLDRPRTIFENEDVTSAGLESMVDVSFLLLIFFLVSSTILSKERDLGMESRPSSDSPRNAEPLAMRIGIRADGSVILNPGEREMVLSSDASDRSLPRLQTQLAMVKAVSGSQEPLILVHPSGEARQQRVVDVLNCLSGSGVQRVSFVDGD